MLTPCHPPPLTRCARSLTRLHCAALSLYGSADARLGAFVAAARHVARSVKQRFKVSPDSPSAELTLTFLDFVELVVRCGIATAVEFNGSRARRTYTVAIARASQLEPVLGPKWHRADARYNDGRVEATLPLTLTYSHQRPNVVKVVFDGFRRVNDSGFELWNSSKRKRTREAKEREAKARLVRDEKRARGGA